MEDFVLYNPTKVHFGKHVMNDLSDTIKKYGNKVLLVYGKGSIKEAGLYDKIIMQLGQAGIEVYEYSGIKSNPVVDDVNSASLLGRKKGVDVVLGVGGGSVIDSSKIISLTIPANHDAWNFYTREKKPKTALPMIAVLTLAATGTEMNPIAVLQNHKTQQKISFGHKFCYPKHSFLDPQNTFTVPRHYTAYGIADLIAHALEAYFGVGEATLSDRFIISIITEAMEYGPELLEDLTNYELRAKIMYAATCALNGMTAIGKKSGDWGVHAAGHILSLLYDIPHGASLTIAYPAWLKLQKQRLPGRIQKLGYDLFHINNIDDTIHKLESFFKSIDCPVRLSDINIEYNKEEMLEVMETNKVSGFHHKLCTEDYKKLVDLFQ